jgi:hypothetical protein
MRHFASPAFWDCHAKLPGHIRELADKNYALLKNDPHHPSLQRVQSIRRSPLAYCCQRRT